jgi:hypothetical protein
MITTLAPSPVFQWVNSLGQPLVNGKLYSYEAGTSTPQATYTDSTGTAANPNPTILDANGSASIWLASNNYKLILTDTFNNVIWTADNINATQTAYLALAGGTVSGTVEFQGNIQFDQNITVSGNVNVIGTLQAPNIAIPDELIIGTNSALFASLVMNGASGSAKQVQYQTAGNFRWAVGPNNSTESGSNTGSDYEIDAYNDAGTILGPALIITRATQNATTYGIWSGPNFIATSDRRLKKNVKPLSDEDCLKWIKDFYPVSYQWRRNDRHDIGFIAQHMLDTLPRVVHENRDGHLGIDYMKLIPVLTQVIQNLLHRVEELEHGTS